MMSDLKKQIADAFMFHWDQQLADGQPISSTQSQLASDLQHLGYPLILNYEPVQNHPRMINNPSKKHVAKNRRFYEYSWVSATVEFKAWLIAKLQPVDDKYQLNAATTQIDLCDLDWYEDYQLIRLADTLWENPKLCLYYLISPQHKLFRLNGTSPPVHEVNKKAPIKLNKDNVLSYLIFFCFFVRGEEGPFYLLESMDDPLVEELRNASSDNQPMLTAYEVVEGTIRSLTLEGINEKGHYLCDGVVSYSNAMFIANFAVHSGGMIDMLDDEPIAADMPFKINAPIT